MVVDGDSDERCGYTYDVSTLPNLGACSCWRPTWREDEYCIWHAEDGSKPVEAYEELAPKSGERLDGAVVRELSINGTDWFENCTVVGAELEAVDMRDSSLVGADLRESSLEEVDARRSDLTGVDLEDASISICDLRNGTLDNARFDQAVFSNVRIDRSTSFGQSLIYEQRLDESTELEVSRSCAQAAIWSYREIQNLHENNALAFEARHYYLKEKDIRRRLAWSIGNYGRAIRAEASRWITGYGMSPWRVVGTAIVVIVVSALLYPTTGGLEETVAPGGISGDGSTTGNQTTITWSIENPESTPRYVLVFVFFRSLYFSVVTFTTLGYGDISPVGDAARTIAGLEALLGQLLVALLVFVLSRRIS